MTELSVFPLLAQGGSNAAIVSFSIYIAAVMVLALLSNRLLRSKSFLSEYFLGSRSLGVWAFALTFAATSSSGGSFIGFPALVYTHGWIVGLWIGSYMIVPIVSMGLIAKRMNQVARQSGAITLPDVLRDRFESPLFGVIGTDWLHAIRCSKPNIVNRSIGLSGVSRGQATNSTAGTSCCENKITLSI